MVKEMETITSPKTGPDRTEEIDMNARPATCSIDTVLFDFGGVLAEEGFANGLRTIARNHGLDDNEFLELAREQLPELAVRQAVFPALKG